MRVHLRRKRVTRRRDDKRFACTVKKPRDSAQKRLHENAQYITGMAADEAIGLSMDPLDTSPGVHGLGVRYLGGWSEVARRNVKQICQ